MILFSSKTVFQVVSGVCVFGGGGGGGWGGGKVCVICISVSQLESLLHL